MFECKEHSVNYLESHDGYTLGDFIRIATREVNLDTIIKNIDDHIKLTPVQLKLNKLASLFLLTSQGITMIHSGQEFARSKVISSNVNVNDPNKGKMDHNSYNKDDETNYINYKHAELNKDLLNYYKGLIELRKKFPGFRRAEYNEIHFWDHNKSKFGVGFILKSHGEVLIILFNADQQLSLDFILPEGTWEVLADKNNAGVKTLYEIKDNIILEPVTGAVLRLKTE
jgi:pullulanase/glycogen debranching enzyme